MAADPTAPASSSARTIPWDLVFQGLGVGAAVAGWIAVVGGGRVWARLEAAHIPATQTLAGLPRELFIVEGLQMLLVPLLLGSVVALFVFFSLRPREQAEEAEREARRAQQDAEQELALAHGNAVRAAQRRAAAKRELDRAEAEAARVRADRERTEGAPNDEQADGRLSEVLARFASATREADAAERRLSHAREVADRAKRDRSAAEAEADRVLARPSGVAKDRRADDTQGASAGWRSYIVPVAAREVVDRFGGGRAALIGALGAVFLVVVALAIADVTWWIVGLSLAASLIAGAVLWWQAGLVAVIPAVGAVISLIVLLANADVTGWIVVLALAGSVASGALLWWLKLPELAGVVALGLMSVGVVAALYDAVTGTTIGVMAAITLAAVWLTLQALARRSARGAALTLFAALALWSGALAFAQERGDRRPDLQHVRVDMKDGAPVPGYFLGRSAERVYVAQDSEGSTVGDPRRHVVMLDDADVERVVYGRTIVLPEIAATEAAEETEAGTGGKSVEDNPIDTPQSGPGPDDDGMPPDDPSGPESLTDPGISPSGADQQEQALASLESTVADSRLRVDIVEVQRAARLLVVNLRIVNLERADAHDPVTLGRHFDDRRPDRFGRIDSLDGIEVVDGTNKETLPVARERGRRGRCLCDDHLSDTRVAPGTFVALSAFFRAPTEDVAEVTVKVPRFGARDVPIR